MSPELHTSKDYNEKTDIWSLGCLLYEMCTFECAFTGQSYEELKQNICEKDLQANLDLTGDIKRITQW